MVAKPSRRTPAARSTAGLLLVATLSLTACKPSNQFAAPPPPKVTVAPPTAEKITRYLTATGNTAAYNSVDLVARVQGFLQAISYTDGAAVKAGDILFTIEPLPYQVKLQQAQAAVTGDQATLTNAQIELDRQTTLQRQDVSSQKNLDDARENRDTAQANLAQAQLNAQSAAITYAYTRVLAPFDGNVSAHLVSVGELVGTEPTKLATITQEAPIYVTFNVSEQDVLRIRAEARRIGLTPSDFSKVPVEIGLQSETGYPHTGHLDYAAPTVDQSTGTLEVRGILDNTDRALLPGYFVRVRVPVQRDVEALLVPDDAIGADQAGRYVLVVGADNTVVQRHITAGEVQGNMRVVESGLKSDERVVIAGIQRAVPGQKVDPQVQTASR
jgi:RND family efflux transporter MFP subunit